jgi:hypothetical protein
VTPECVEIWGVNRALSSVVTEGELSDLSTLPLILLHINQSSSLLPPGEEGAKVLVLLVPVLQLTMCFTLFGGLSYRTLTHLAVNTDNQETGQITKLTTGLMLYLCPSLR